MLLEAQDHEHNSFVTLTYSPEHLPTTKQGVPALRIGDYQRWLKRLRKRLGQQHLRYFLVGEYGKDHSDGRKVLQFGRPHYHALLFGYSPCLRGVGASECTCQPCTDIRESWGLGFTLNGTVSPQSAAYVASYVTKKTVDRDDEIGRPREFTRMSLKPGIGFRRMELVAAELKSTQGDKLMDDVPSTLRHGEKEWPLGPAMRRRLRVGLGRDPKIPDKVTHKWSMDLLPVRSFARGSTSSISKIVAELNRGRCDEVEARLSLSRKKL